MSISKKLAQQALEKRQQVKALTAKETLTAEESKQVDTLLDEAETLDKDAKAAKAREDRLAENERAIGQARTPAARRLGADDENEQSDTIAVPAWKKDPKRGYASLQAFLRDLLHSARVHRPSEQLRSLQPGRSFWEGVEGMRAAAGSDESSTFYDPSLGAMVPKALIEALLTTSAPVDPFPNTLRAPLDVPMVQIRARVDKNHATSVSGGFRMYRRGESQPVDPSKTEIEKITLSADALMGVTFETEELLRDAGGLVLAMIQNGFRDESGSTRVREILNGNGVGRNLGWRQSPCVITVDKETGQKADSIVLENLVNLLSRVWGEGRWLANPTCMPKLVLLNGGTNGLVWQPSAREGVPGTLLGRPLTFSEYMPAVGDEGDIAICNDSQYIEVVRQDLETEESMHVRFLEHERTFKFTERRGGAPWWRSALTPVNGQTLSPYVQLGAR